MTYTYCPNCGKTLGEREDGGALRQACEDDACGFIFYNNPVPVVAALVQVDGDVILARNKEWPESHHRLPERGQPQQVPGCCRR